MASEVQLRKSCHNQLNGFLNQLNAHPTKPLDYHGLITIKTRVAATMTKCERYHDILLAAAADDAALLTQEAAFEPIEKTYQEVQNKIGHLLLTIPNPAATASTSATSGAAATAAGSVNIRLPAIELPTFNGSYSTWFSFTDLFIATVDKNPHLGNAQKLQYLKSALQGEPANLVRSMTITDLNYNEAWTLLNDRYDNKREIVHSLISRFLDYKQLKSENAQELQALIDCVSESVRSLKVLSCPTDKWDDLLCVIVLSKLDPSTKREWAIRQSGSNLPTFDEMCKFLSSHIRGLLATGATTSVNNPSVKREKPVRVHHVNSEPTKPCKICNKKHFHFQCNELHSKPVLERCSLIKSHHLCFNCLGRDHPVSSCSSQKSCHKCGKRHHTLLHLDGPQRETSTAKPQQPAVSTQDSKQQKSASVQSHHISVDSHVIMKTAVVDVPDRFGTPQKCRVFIDGGSQGDFISEACASRLQLQRSQHSVTVKGFGSTHVGRSRGEVQLTLISRFNRGNSISLKAHVMPRLSSFLPSTRCTNKPWPHLKGLQLADPLWNKPAHVDIVIGMKQFFKVIMKDRREGSEHDPIAVESIFGWIVGGEVQENDDDNSSIVSLHISVSPDLDFIRRFWEMEELPNPRILTKEEKECEQHFIRTHQRDKSGRFVVAVPFNGKQKQLGVSREAAVKRLQQVERRLQRNPHYRDQYVGFMKEYLELGHMAVIPPDQVRETPGSTFYLPHHFVLNEDSTTTKLRVVFDGSAKTSSGLSLNDTMKVGATLQDDLYELLLRLRTYPIVLKADVAKMFRQFLLHHDDADFHRIVWRETPDQPIRDFRLVTFTYGTACATNLSTRCIQQLAIDCGEQYPSASSALRESMFVDDLLVGENTPEQAIAMFKELQLAVATAGLELRKWCTNHPTVLKAIPADLREMNPQSFDDEDSSVKTLGVRWHPNTDDFRFTTFSFKREDKPTMRILLSNLARVFDPLGLISYITIRAKLMYQELWRLSLGWDDAIPPHINQLWSEYENDLKLLTKLRIQRRITVDGATRVELHGFSDSSEKALGGLIYLRCVTGDEVSVQLITSRTKVAPLKQVTLPRLELDAALLTAKTIVKVSNALKLIDVQWFLYTDSTITLNWISSPPRRWKTFVANRVAKIQELTPVEAWRHVPGTENPADLASRGVEVAELIQNTLWWKGPDWLSKPELPVFVTPAMGNVDAEERNLPVLVNNVEVDHLSSILQRYSSLVKIKRVTAFLQRFIVWITKKKVPIGPLTPIELNSALFFWIRRTQQQDFVEDLKHLKKNNRVKPNSKLRSLHPYIDKDGVLRVSGRLQHADLPEQNKHQIILDGGSHLVYLLVHHLHHSTFHAGFQQTWSSLQREYWIIRGRDRVRHIIRSCVVCRRYRGAAAEQLMGNLPVSRVTPARPFLHTGLDFAGVFNLKNPIGRVPKTYKGYLCIFVCMATKAVHLESVSSLSTDAFMDAFRRFVSRRGLCSDLYSDNGTNFIGAERELKKFVRDRENNVKIADGLSSSSIKWHFNPPSAPHHGGLWEAAVKSAKFHLRRVIGNSNLTFEQFATVLCQIEAVLNSRPLTPLSSDPGDYGALTPGHLLIGEPLVAIPEGNVENVPINRLNVYKQQQQRVQHFWRRWSREYLNTLQQRNKWRWERDNVRVGDLVLLVEETSPGAWKLARVQETHEVDGKVRIVTVKTATSVMQRPIVKLVPLFREEN